MAKDTYAAVTALSLFNALKRLSASFLSGKNNDATDYSIPVEVVSVGAGSGALESGGNLDAIAASLATLDNLSAAGAGAVGATVQRVTLASDDPAVASLSVLDDWDEANRAAVNLIAGQVAVAGGAGAAGATVLRTVTATDSLEITRLTSLVNTLAPTIVHGIAGARFTSADASGADAAVSDAPTGGQKLTIKEVTISVDTDMRVDLKEETSGTVLHSGYMLAKTTIQLRFTKKKLATADKKLMVRTSAAGNVAIDAAYYSEA